MAIFVCDWLTSKKRRNTITLILASVGCYSNIDLNEKSQLHMCYQGLEGGWWCWFWLLWWPDTHSLHRLQVWHPESWGSIGWNLGHEKPWSCCLWHWFSHPLRSKLYHSTSSRTPAREMESKEVKLHSSWLPSFKDSWKKIEHTWEPEGWMRVNIPFYPKWGWKCRPHISVEGVDVFWQSTKKIYWKRAKAIDWRERAKRLTLDMEGTLGNFFFRLLLPRFSNYATFEEPKLF